MSFGWLTRSVSGRVQVESRAQSETRSALRDEVSCRSLAGKTWWAGTGLNRRHQDFQSCALPTELPAHHEVARIPDGVGSVYEPPPQSPLTLPSPPMGEREKGCYFSGRSAPVSDSKTISSSSSMVK